MLEPVSLSLSCCFISLARWMDPQRRIETVRGKTIGQDMTLLQFYHEEDILMWLYNGYTYLIWIFSAQSWAHICTLCGASCTILHILINCPHFDKGHACTTFLETNTIAFRMTGFLFLSSSDCRTPSSEPFRFY
jgi:hypothetical protein